jgi:hypothetical protein
LTERSNASSPGSQRQGASAHTRVCDHAGPYGRSHYRARTCCLPPIPQRRHPESCVLRGSMAGLCTPLPTLRPYPRGHRRTARGRCGSLLLHRGGLSPPTPCRFHRRTECYTVLGHAELMPGRGQECQSETDPRSDRTSLLRFPARAEASARPMKGWLAGAAKVPVISLTELVPRRSLSLARSDSSARRNACRERRVHVRPPSLRLRSRTHYEDSAPRTSCPSLTRPRSHDSGQEGSSFTVAVSALNGAPHCLLLHSKPDRAWKTSGEQTAGKGAQP